MSPSAGRPSWSLPDNAVTEESAYSSRRRFLGALGLGGSAGVALALGARGAWVHRLTRGLPVPEALRARVASEFIDAGRTLTPEEVATRYNNYYEFSTDKRRVFDLARNFVLDPYTLRVDGLVERPGNITLERIEALGLQERVYRFRCVEAWAMTVPWIGVPLRDVLALAGPQPEARYVALQSFDDPEQAPGQREGTYTFPYYEALRIEEAENELALVATGLYGKRLTPQNGAPLRLVLPWKYGYKSPKSVVRLRLTRDRPQTFWNDLQPREYSWLSNVDPAVPHPRWSQRFERLLGSGERVPTEAFNGYGREVAHLYRG